MRAGGHENAGASEVFGVLTLAVLTFLLAGTVLTLTGQFEMPDADEAVPDARPSPFSSERVAGTFEGDFAERTLYDSSSKEVLSGDPNGGNYRPPLRIDDEVANRISELDGSPPLPETPTGGNITVDSGEYYLNSSNYIWINWDNERVVFDNSDGPVVIGLDGDGFFNSGRIQAEDTEFAFKGTYPVEVYVERSSFSSDINLEDIEFDTRRTDLFRIYAQSDKGGSKAEINIKGGSEFRGIVYAPGSEVEVEDSEFYGASVAETTTLNGSSYYHDKTLEVLGRDSLP